MQITQCHRSTRSRPTTKWRHGQLWSGKAAMPVFAGLLTLLGALLVTTTATCMGADTPTVEQIVQRSNQAAYYQGDDGRADVRMTIRDAQGRTRNRQFTILRRDESPPDKAGADNVKTYTGDQRFYVYFHAPPDVKDTVFMVWKHVDRDKDDDRWLYLPALDLVKRIAASDERTSFVGSHFYYEDVSGRNTNEDNHELLRTTGNYFVLKNIPKDPGQVDFAHYTMWIHRTSYIPVKTVYYNDKGEKYREYSVQSVTTIQGYTTVTKSTMKDLRSGGETVIEYSGVEYDVGLPRDVFSERYLRKPPMKYLK